MQFTVCLSGGGLVCFDSQDTIIYSLSLGKLTALGQCHMVGFNLIASILFSCMSNSGSLLLPTLPNNFKYLKSW